MRIPIKKLCTAAVLMALTVCATAFMSFPVPNMQGAYVPVSYTHLRQLIPAIMVALACRSA